MSPIFVKVCGITTADAATAVAESGADAIGFVFAPGSPREVTAEKARALAETLPATVETVGVFRNQSIDEVLATARTARLSTVQLHGDEPTSDFDRLRSEGFETIRALSIDSYRQLSDSGGIGLRDRLLIDAVTPGGGETFDPNLLGDARPTGSWILAGGLTPHNVARLVYSLRPHGVDVSSGVEVRRGVKSPDLIHAFVAAARSV